MTNKPSEGFLVDRAVACCFPEESSVHSDSTVEADTNADLMPASLKQPNLTLELFPNHSENLESAKKVTFWLASVCLKCTLTPLIRSSHCFVCVPLVFCYFCSWVLWWRQRGRRLGSLSHLWVLRRRCLWSGWSDLMISVGTHLIPSRFF